MFETKHCFRSSILSSINIPVGGSGINFCLQGSNFFGFIASTQARSGPFILGFGLFGQILVLSYPFYHVIHHH